MRCRDEGVDHTAQKMVEELARRAASAMVLAVLRSISAISKGRDRAVMLLVRDDDGLGRYRHYSA